MTSQQPALNLALTLPYPFRFKPGTSSAGDCVEANSSVSGLLCHTSGMTSKEDTTKSSRAAPTAGLEPFMFCSSCMDCVPNKKKEIKSRSCSLQLTLHKACIRRLRKCAPFPTEHKAPIISKPTKSLAQDPKSNLKPKSVAAAVVVAASCRNRDSSSGNNILAECWRNVAIRDTRKS